MKKILFLIPFFILIIIIYIFSSKENFNKEYMENNIEIYYPSFSNLEIDNYLKKYLNEEITNFKEKKYEYLFIDYDYDNDNKILTMYKYQNLSNKIKYQTNSFKITKNIKEISATVSTYYDFYYQKEINSKKPMIAFTFDDGPNYNTAKTLNILNKYHVKATFFILGNRIKGNEKIIAKMHESGMQIGNHTYSHLLLTRYKEEKITKEISKTNELIYNIINEYPTLLRPSYGIINNKVKKISNKPIVMWNMDTLDWKYHNSKKIANKILNKVKDGDVILMHDIYSATANSLEIVIPRLIEQGYQLVTVSELFYYKNKSLENGKVYFNAR